MTPHGDCPSCEKKQRIKDEAEGRIKRAKNIAVGDIIKHPMCFKIDAFPVFSVEHTTKGKVIVNKGHGGCSGEETFWGEQWIDVVGKVAEV